MADRNYKITILLPYEYDTAPGQRFRWEQWQRHLEADGLSIDLVSFSTPAIGAARRNRAALRSAVLFAARYLPWFAGVWQAARRSDLIVVHRNAALTGPPLAEAILSAVGRPLVYDLDDAIYISADGDDSFLRRLARCDWRCGFIGKRSRLVGAGSPVLGGYMRRFNGNIAVWPTTVDTEAYQIRPEPDANAVPVVGWSGSHSTARYIEMILPALGALQRETAFEVLIVGAELDLAGHGVTGRCVPWSAATEIESIRQMDIGLMPLPNTEWARGKCALKAIQYLAFGIPAVVSDVGVNRDVVIDNETGLLVAPDGDWAPALRTLLADPALRRRMGLKGREHVVANYSAAAVAKRVAQDLRAVMEAG